MIFFILYHVSLCLHVLTAQNSEDFLECILLIVESLDLYLWGLSGLAAVPVSFLPAAPCKRLTHSSHGAAFLSCFCSSGPISGRTWELCLLCVLTPPIWKDHRFSQRYLPDSGPCRSSLLSLPPVPLLLGSPISFKGPIDYK